MTVAELLEFDLRKKNILIRADKRTKLYLPNESESVSVDTHTFTILKVSDEVTDIKAGDIVIPAYGALSVIPVKDETFPKDSYIFYTEESFIKMFKRS